MSPISTLLACSVTMLCTQRGPICRRKPSRTQQANDVIEIDADQFDATVTRYVDELGYRLDAIFPADAPRVARLSSNGEQLEIRAISSDMQRHPPAALAQLFVQQASAGDWIRGRAGMLYRDLVPDRCDGGLIASHIRIPVGGPVADYVHHHHVQFQMIMCLQGWVRVVYEDQGPSFVMQAGDLVVQPPHIRHRVLECSDAFAALEIACPAEHETLVEHEIQLPNATVNAERNFSGQQFLLHRAADTDWTPGTSSDTCQTNVAQSTGGLADVWLERDLNGEFLRELPATDKALFGFVLSGSASATSATIEHKLSADSAFLLQAGESLHLAASGAPFKAIFVRLPIEDQ